MYQQFRHMMIRLHTNFQRKAKWTSGESELVRLLELALPLGKTNKPDVQEFLVKNNIFYDRETNVGRLELDANIPVDFIYICGTRGPTIWDRGFPFGSQYTILFCFDNSEMLILIKASLFVFHL